MLPAFSQSVEQVSKHEIWSLRLKLRSRGFAPVPVRQVQVPSEEQRPPRMLPAWMQEVEQVE
jgi:hypothetical protein